MESFEGGHQSEINTEELLQVINSLSLTFGEEFEYNGSLYHLTLVEKEDEEIRKAGGAMYFRSRLNDPWDIHLLESLLEADKRRLLFHEVLECNLQEQGSQEEAMSVEPAHKIAVQTEESLWGPRNT
jgi:hypothetical protein